MESWIRLFLSAVLDLPSSYSSSYEWDCDHLLHINLLILQELRCVLCFVFGSVMNLWMINHAVCYVVHVYSFCIVYTSTMYCIL